MARLDEFRGETMAVRLIVIWSLRRPFVYEDLF